jgi:hypothetical protein
MKGGPNLVILIAAVLMLVVLPLIGEYLERRRKP